MQTLPVRTRARERGITWLPRYDSYYIVAGMLHSSRDAWPLFVLQGVLVELEQRLRGCPHHLSYGILTGALCVCPRTRQRYVLVDGSSECEPVPDAADAASAAAAVLGSRLAELDQRRRLAVGCYFSGGSHPWQPTAEEVGLLRLLFPEPCQCILLHDGGEQGGGAFIRVEPAHMRAYAAPFVELLPGRRIAKSEAPESAVTWSGYHPTEVVAPLGARPATTAPLSGLLRRGLDLLARHATGQRTTDAAPATSAAAPTVSAIVEPSVGPASPDVDGSASGAGVLPAAPSAAPRLVAATRPPVRPTGARPMGGSPAAARPPRSPAPSVARPPASPPAPTATVAWRSNGQAALGSSRVPQRAGEVQGTAGGPHHPPASASSAPIAPEVISPEVISSAPISPEVISPEVSAPEVSAPEVVAPEVGLPDAMSSGTTSVEAASSEPVSPEREPVTEVPPRHDPSRDHDAAELEETAFVPFLVPATEPGIGGAGEPGGTARSGAAALAGRRTVRRATWALVAIVVFGLAAWLRFDAGWGDGAAAHDAETSTQVGGSAHGGTAAGGAAPVPVASASPPGVGQDAAAPDAAVSAARFDAAVDSLEGAVAEFTQTAASAPAGRPEGSRSCADLGESYVAVELADLSRSALQRRADRAVVAAHAERLRGLEQEVRGIRRRIRESGCVD